MLVWVSGQRLSLCGDGGWMSEFAGSLTFVGLLWASSGWKSKIWWKWCERSFIICEATTCAIDFAMVQIEFFWGSEWCNEESDVYHMAVLRCFHHFWGAACRKCGLNYNVKTQAMAPEMVVVCRNTSASHPNAKPIRRGGRKEREREMF